MISEPLFDGAALAKTLPQQPGVYRMYDKAEKLLYVGKAKNLLKRVGSYFLNKNHDARIASMVKQIARIEITVVRTEAEALVLESRLVKTDNPKYNIQLRDDRGYPYLHLSTDNDVPQLRIHRGKKGKTGRYFGPFPSGEAVAAAEELLQRHFQLRTCSDRFFASRSRPCLEYQIGRCSGPCANKINKQDYQEKVKELENFLDGKSDLVIDSMATKMDQASNILDFEKAATYRDQIVNLRAISARMDVEGGEGNLDAISVASREGVVCVSVVFVRSGQMLGSRSFLPMVPYDAGAGEILEQFLGQYYLDKPRPSEIVLGVTPDNLDLLQEVFGKTKIKVGGRTERAGYLSLAEKNAKAGLASRLQSDHLMELRRSDLVKILSLEHPPSRIECFDISHTMGQATVASCVVFGPAGPIKNQYRRYNITGITGGDDYAAMKQALTRRLTGDMNHPDLLLIDGGQGQVRQAIDVCQSLNLTIAIVGVSKGPARKAGEETLVVVDQNTEINPGVASPGLQLIQQVRDEAHRFAIEGHRKKRDKSTLASSLEAIEGLGPTKRQALLRSFGGLQGVKAAGVEELMRADGISRKLAEKIYANFHGL